MGDEDFMKQQIHQKLTEGYTCLKMKIGALSFDKEVSILENIRKKYSKDEVILRVDANGAFTAEEAEEKLKILAGLDIHSIEQPIKQGNIHKMRKLCRKSPVPIALDEELIGIFDVKEKEKLLQTIRPQFIILKPSLLGGFAKCLEWITLAHHLGIGWWITSALESNIGLNAIAQWTYTLSNPLPQGLGTGSLFTNNFEGPLEVEKGKLYYRPALQWDTNLIKELCS
jgi:L-alanine-DL-glutamate epimerase-like enolase superfamily enzyme